jgi:hypothetical protein
MNVLEQTEWYKQIVKNEHIYIFGAGSNARGILVRVRDHTDKQIDGFIVSNLEENPSSVEGYPVFELMDSDLNRDALVIMSTSADNNDKISSILKQAGFGNVIPGLAQMKTMKNNQSVFDLKINTLKEEHSPMIYIVTSHLNQHSIVVNYGLSSEVSSYIQAGAELTDKKLCPVLDNTGDNISAENQYFCELTAGYWIAKNDKIHDWLGLFHYSRGLELRDDDINKIVNSDIEVVMPSPLKFSQQMACELSRKDLEIMFMALPENYKEAFNKYLLGYTFHRGNILFARADIFKAYYEWMMEIIRKCKAYMEQQHLLIPKRLWGYYGEHLINLYFLKNEFKLLHANLKNC